MHPMGNLSPGLRLPVGPAFRLEGVPPNDHVKFDHGMSPIRSEIDSRGMKMTEKRSVDPMQRRAEIMIATLFLVTAAASIPAAFVLDPILNAPDYLARVFPNKGEVELGPCCGRSTTLGSSSSRCLRLACSENSMKPWRSGTWLPGSSRAQL